jgi:hypothetical protein
MGLAVVACTGMLSEVLGVPPGMVAEERTSVNFLVTSYILAQLPVPTLSAFLFFIFVTFAVMEAQVRS